MPRAIPADLGRGLAVGLWVLAGLFFFLDALLPHTFGGAVLAPALLALAVLDTALLPAGPPPGASGGARLTRQRVALVLLGAVLASGTALVIVREGDRRSFLYAGMVAVLAILPALSRPPSRVA